MTRKRLRNGIALVLFALAAYLAISFGFHALPFSWTGEADRLAELVGARPGAAIADIGAGTGTYSVEMARRVGPTGVVYATEINPARLDDIRKAATDAALSNIRPVEAGERDTNLPDACCDGIFLRNVFHHIDDKDAFARSVRRALRANGCLVIIDFAPGTLWPFAGEHGVSPDAVAAALSTAGFTKVQHIDRWGGRLYASVFK